MSQRAARPGLTARAARAHAVRATRRCETWSPTWPTPPSFAANGASPSTC